MSEKKIISIVGATGNQGGALLRAIVAANKAGDNEFIARAITRDAKSAKAQALTELGVEVVQADVANASSLAEAIKGSYGFYCVTAVDFSNPKAETQQAKAMADAARQAGIKHAIWSTLDDTKKFIKPDDELFPTLHGEYKVPHFDAKAEADAFFADLPTTYMLTPFFFDNFAGSMLPRKAGQDGKFALHIPSGKLPIPGIGVEDIGKCAFGIFKAGQALINKHLGIAGDVLTFEDYAATLTKVFGKPIVYNEAPISAFRKMGFPGAEDIASMFQFYLTFNDNLLKTRSVDEAKKLNPELKSFEQWLVANKNRINLE